VGKDCGRVNTVLVLFQLESDLLNEHQRMRMYMAKIDSGIDDQRWVTIPLHRSISIQSPNKAGDGEVQTNMINVCVFNHRLINT